MRYFAEDWADFGHKKEDSCFPCSDSWLLPLLQVRLSRFLCHVCGSLQTASLPPAYSQPSPTGGGSMLNATELRLMGAEAAAHTSRGEEDGRRHYQCKGFWTQQWAWQGTMTTMRSHTWSKWSLRDLLSILMVVNKSTALVMVRDPKQNGAKPCFEWACCQPVLSLAGDFLPIDQTVALQTLHPSRDTAVPRNHPLGQGHAAGTLPHPCVSSPLSLHHCGPTVRQWRYLAVTQTSYLVQQMWFEKSKLRHQEPSLDWVPGVFPVWSEHWWCWRQSSSRSRSCWRLWNQETWWKQCHVDTDTWTSWPQRRLSC